MSEQPASTSRPEIARTDSGGTAPRAENNGEKGKGQAGSSVQRTTRYKEKFLTMKERYEVVTAAHEKYERELTLANEKIRKLQNECNLLLDAVDIAVPGQPTLLHYLYSDPVASHYMMMNAPVYDNNPPPPPPPQAEPIPPPTPSNRTPTQTTPAPHTNGTNGHI
ncbi:hypothetical protein PHLGIDRAFT_38118 [Phlebiopsis gigantea 11061_1 CR5-6]|uniref:Uncharacterized protein n=1 Tax=Phlebiopsis gigantea (strain 11061_1 CR5-6) TaxID=745531 RepID=A0A0C3S2N0_PHLG1|nr:hypothetical protein PHLGIDRAFT_38118 [Phlebiopsis gigantea 11061_1 CR5-6]